MLALTRNKGERVVINGNIFVSVDQGGRDQFKVLIDAPRYIPIWREEVAPEPKARDPRAFDRVRKAAEQYADAAAFFKLARFQSSDLAESFEANRRLRWRRLSDAIRAAFPDNVADKVVQEVDSLKELWEGRRSFGVFVASLCRSLDAVLER